MEEIFDREHDDESTYHEPYVAQHNTEGNHYGDETKCCSHCGSDIPPMVVVCPQCGKWWTNSES